MTLYFSIVILLLYSCALRLGAGSSRLLFFELWLANFLNRVFFAYQNPAGTSNVQTFDRTRFRAGPTSKEDFQCVIGRF